MSNPVPVTPFDPTDHFVPDDAVGQWGPRQGPPGFPPEVPRHPPHETPEWTPQNPQEVPIRNPTPIPDWSPSSGFDDPPIIEDEQFPPTKNDSPPRPDGKHDLGDDPDKRSGPAVREDPNPAGQPADEGGDIEEPGSQNPTPLNTGSVAAPITTTPSGRPMRPTAEEAYY